MRRWAALLSGLAAAGVCALWAAVAVDSAVVRLDLAAVRLLNHVATDEVTALAAGVTALASTTAVLLVGAAGHAFPSAHAASGVALYGLLAVLLLRRVHGRARIAAAALAVGVIGLTRIYLGVHYPSDVLAGWLVGALVAFGAWQLVRGLRGCVSLPCP